MGGNPYLIVGYVVTWAVLIWYIRRLERRSTASHRALDAAESTGRALHESETE